MLIAAVSFAACEEPIPDGPNKENPDSAEVADTIAIPAMEIPAEAITVSEARNICAGLESGAVTEQAYYVKGWVKKIHDKHAEGVSGYGNGQFYMSENQLKGGTYDNDDFMAYQVYYLDNKKFTSADQVQVGDYVVIYGKLTNYSGTYETEGKGKAYVYATSTPREGQVTPEPELGDTITVQDMLDMTANGTMPNKDGGSYQKWVKGYIVGAYDFNASDKFALTGTTGVETNILIADDPENTDSYKVASVKLSAGIYCEALNLKAHPENYKKEVLLYGTIEKYCGIGGIVNITNAVLDGTPIGNGGGEVEIDYLEGEMSVSDFLAHPTIAGLTDGNTTEEEFTVRGVVKEVKTVSLTYGNAQFYITDGKNDLLCYNIFHLDGAKFVHADQIQVGDIVTVKSVVTNYQGTIEPKGGYITRTTNTFDASTVDTTPKEITVKDALALNLAADETADGLYTLTGAVKTVTEAFGSFGNATFTITDDSCEEEFICYRTKYLGNEKWKEGDRQIQAGDIITVIGAIKNYKGTTIELVDGYISAWVE